MADKLKISLAPQLWHGGKYQDKDDKRKVEATVKTHCRDWSSIAKMLSKLHITEKKEKGPYMVFADFTKASERMEGEFTRRNEHVGQFYGVVLDVDETELEFDEIKEALDNTGLNYVLYTTHSYDPWTEGKEHKFRIVVPYDKPASRDEQPTLVVGFATMIGMEADYDNCSKTASQPMYLHSATGGRKSEALSASNVKGTFLNTDEAYSLGEMQDGGSHGAKTPVSSFGEAVEEGDRHSQFARHMARRRRDGLTFEEVLGEIRIWNAKLDNPLPDDQVDGLQRVWEGFERNHNAFGFQHHKDLISHTPMQQRDIYMSALQGIVDSEEQLNNGEREELFRDVKSKRPGSTLSSIRADYDDLVETLQEQVEVDIGALKLKFHKKLKEMYSGYVYLTSMNNVFHIPSRKYLKKEGFVGSLCSAWGHLRKEFYPIQAADKNKRRPLRLDALLEEQILPTVHDVGYEPAQDKFFTSRGQTLCNQYVKPTLESVEGAVKPLHLYFEYLFPDKEASDFMKQWLAFMVQRPGVKIKYMPVIYTPLEQVGKDFFMKFIIGPVLGRENISRVTTGYVQENYTEALTGYQLILMQELDFGRDKRLAQKVADKLKPFISDTEVQLRRFGIAGGMVDHNSSFIGFTNYMDAVFTEGGGQRYYLIDGPKFRQSGEWYAKMKKWFLSHEGEVLNYFQTLDISEFPYARNPGNKATDKAQHINVYWPMNVLNEAIEEGELDGMTALPWKYFIKLLYVLSSPDDQLKADRLLQRGTSKMQQNILAQLERFGYKIVDVGAERGVNLPTPESEGGQRSNRRKQKVISFPETDVNKDNFKVECDNTIKLLTKLSEDVEF